MNFLVHLFVSQHDEYLQIGNWMGDLVRNKHIPELPPGIKKGIILHRAIDTFSDNHNIIRQGIKRIRDRQQKYSPVVVDIFYDYLLYNNWNEFSERNFSKFTSEFYDRLKRWSPVYPEHVQKRAVSMAEHQFLEAYTSKIGLQDVYRRVGERANFDHFMYRAIEDLFDHWEEYNEDFLKFFPDLLEFVNEFSKEQL